MDKQTSADVHMINNSYAREHTQVGVLRWQHPSTCECMHYPVYKCIVTHHILFSKLAIQRTFGSLHNDMPAHRN